MWQWNCWLVLLVLSGCLCCVVVDCDDEVVVCVVDYGWFIVIVVCAICVGCVSYMYGWCV